MADDKLAQKRNTGSRPVEAEPNHDREKTYEPPTTPQSVRDAKQTLPENTTRDKVREGMPEAAEEIKKRG